MAITNILLREDVENLGVRGDIVKVKAGYARNYLLPRKLAVQATSSNVKQIEQERQVLAHREAKERGSAEEQAATMGALQLNFERRAGEHGILYGSVTSMDIAEALKEKGYDLDRRRITLREPIKELGDFTVQVRLHREVIVEVPIIVTTEGGSAQASAAAAATTIDAAAATNTPDLSTPATTITPADPTTIQADEAELTTG